MPRPLADAPPRPRRGRPGCRRWPAGSAGPGSRWRPRSAPPAAGSAGPAPAPGSRGTSRCRCRPAPADAGRTRDADAIASAISTWPGRSLPPMPSTAYASTSRWLDRRPRRRPRPVVGHRSTVVRSRASGYGAAQGVRGELAGQVRVDPGGQPGAGVGVLAGQQLTGPVDPVDQVAPLVRHQRPHLDLRSGQPRLDHRPQPVDARARSGPRPPRRPGTRCAGWPAPRRTPGRPC